LNTKFVTVTIILYLQSEINEDKATEPKLEGSDHEADQLSWGDYNCSCGPSKRGKR